MIVFGGASFLSTKWELFAAADFVTLAKQVTDVLELVLNKYIRILKLLSDESVHCNPLFSRASNNLTN